MGWIILKVVFWAAGVSWVLLAWEILRCMGSVKRLPDCRPKGSTAKVSVIIAVRDEAARIEKTVRQVMGQEGVDLELIVVNDRSRDGTGEILRKLGEEFPRLKVVTVDVLPENWLGKCHAMHVGGHSASGDWMLFTDGDVWLSPDAIARAIAVAEDLNVEHITLAPRQHFAEGQKPGALYQSCMLMFHMIMNLELGRANRDAPNSMAGIGAFNLIRADIYKKIGGHEALRMEVADDMKLGLLVRRANLKSRALLAEDAVECDWAASVGGIKRALEKNMWAGMNFSMTLALCGTAAFLFLGAVPLVALFYLPHPSAIAAAIGLPMLVIVTLVQAYKNRWRLWPALLAPFAGLIIHGIFWNSVLKTLRQGGIRWRDTFYPLAMLRAGRLKRA